MPLPPGEKDSGAEETVGKLVRKFQGKRANPYEGDPIAQRLQRGAQVIIASCNHRAWWHAVALEAARRAPYHRKDFRQWAGQVEFYWTLRDQKVAHEDGASPGIDPLADRFKAHTEGLRWPELDRCGVVFPIRIQEPYAGSLPARHGGIVWLGDRDGLRRAEQAGQLAIYSCELTELMGVCAAEPESARDIWRGFWAVRNQLGNGDGKPLRDRSWESLKDISTKRETKKVST